LIAISQRGHDGSPSYPTAVRDRAAMGVQMVDGIDKRPSSENRALIREILMRQWDPIRLRTIAGAPENEYDRYIDRIYALVADRHPSEEKISAYLLDVQSRRMGLRITDAARERCHRAAQSLIAAQVEFKRPTGEPW
jgi:hypothetical protein